MDATVTAYGWACADCDAAGAEPTRKLAHAVLAAHIGAVHNVVPWGEE